MSKFVVEATEIEEVKIIRPHVVSDLRGTFSEVYNQRDFESMGILYRFVQDNQSHSPYINTIRGLHFQKPPHAQAKIVRVLQGSVLDVAVDLRSGSATEGQHIMRVLSAENYEQLLIPEGFAHGFRTLENDTVVLYKVTDFYSTAHEQGIFWNDAALAIDWGVDAGRVVLSKRDQQHPGYEESRNLFTFSA